MAATGTAAALRQQFSIPLIASYIIDWILLAALAIGSYVLGNIKPNFRNFSLADPNIAFPFAERETFSNMLLFVCCGVIPVIVVLVVTLILVPGGTVPKGTPALLVWKRKLWELQISWLGLLMAVGSAWFFVSGLKNMCGKPRPDMLSRCLPNMTNADKYIVGGYQIQGANGHLYSAAICTQTDQAKLWDGFRSYPSGHAAASAGGLLYLSLFLASKFAVTLPWIMAGSSENVATQSAFPSRHGRPDGPPQNGYEDGNESSWPLSAKNGPSAKLHGARTRAAAPPVFLLVITLVPFCLAMVISASRWFNYRHHGFDILFGFFIGTICAIYSFRYYHMPIQDGAGWAWGPRNPARAFWAGVGNVGYGTPGADRGAETADMEAYPQTAVSRGPNQRTGPHPEANTQYNGQYGAGFEDVELQRLNQGENRV
ncbi:PAP2 domain containing protein [Cordyceps fumosorosea ARSEF 2679]|uniref:PAP2 domain containing protein n=1 Tax=Cordyceps fumosorosea (strain ARSEF 2679) TaxID=1081104 RepID=A0A167WMA9_CORFA|nr:PAP2 domain containing protein [Cordyceps fumosorosea ARSEF 2679]OAA63968.1 PAP2 domain containing protein [Cordyceps fumosorosea ARSEF 2679]